MKILSNFNVNFTGDTNNTRSCGKKYQNLAPLDKDIVSFKGAIKSEEISPELKEAQDKLANYEKEAQKLQADYELLKQKYERLSQRYTELLLKKDSKTEDEKEEQAQIQSEIWDLKFSLRKMSNCKRMNENHINSHRKYCAQLELNPKTAFLYAPSLSKKEKIKKAKEAGILTSDELAESLGISKESLGLFLRNEKIDYEVATNMGVRYIDPAADKNKAFLLQIEPMLKNAVSAISAGVKYNLKEEDIVKLLHDGKLKVIGLDGTETFKGTISTALINPDDEDNIAAFEKYANTNYHPSKYFDMVGKKGAYLPANYLSKIGYGEVKNIRNAIQKGLIGGRIEQVETPQGTKTRTMVDVSDRTKLRALFDDAVTEGYTLTTSDFAHLANTSNARVKKAIDEGEVEIIAEYLLTPLRADMNARYFDPKNEKNQKFIEKIKKEHEFEKVQEAKKKRRK